MNKLILVLTFLVSTSLFASERPSFSAFASGDSLYLTMMVDQCNSHGAGLKLAPNCVMGELGKPMTTDYVTTCKAQVQVRSTKRACRGDSKYVAQDFTIDLKSYNLRKTINSLELSDYSGSTVEVDLIDGKNIGAFVVDKELQLTVMGDSCNSIGASLVVDKLCDKDRLTKNHVITCKAELLVFQTEMACDGMSSVPRVTSINLEETQVDPSARTLEFKYYNKLISIDLQ